MTRSRRQCTTESERQVLREVEFGKSLAHGARVHALDPNLIRKWQTQYAEYGQQAFAGNGRAYSDEAKIAELERLIGQLTIENAFLKRLLAHLEAKHAAGK